MMKTFINYTKEPLYKNSYFLIANTALVSIFGFVFWSIATRMYSTHDIGLTVNMISIISLLSVFSNLGFSSSLIRYLPTTNGKEYKSIINTCFTVTGIISLLFTLFFLIEVEYLSPELTFVKENWYFSLLFIIFSIFMSLNTLHVSIFIGKREPRLELIKNMSWNILKIIFLFIFVSSGAFGVFSSFGFSLVIAFLLGTFFLLPKIHSEYSPVLTINTKVISDLKNYSFGNYLADFFMTAPSYVLPIMVANILSPNEAAYFYMAWMITGLVMIIPTAISNSFFAEGSYDEESTYKTLQKSLLFTFALLLPTTIILLLFGSKALLIFGKSYSDNATNTLLLLVLSCLPYSFNRMYITLKKIEKSMKPVISINASLALIGLGLSYLFMNSNGLVGVAIGWALGQGIVMIGLVMVILSKLWLSNSDTQKKAD